MERIGAVVDGPKPPRCGAPRRSTNCASDGSAVARLRLLTGMRAPVFRTETAVHACDGEP
jgi:hypothetical protein